MQPPVFGTKIYWRFKGDKAWKYGYPIKEDKGLVRMGRWHGDTVGGPVVDLKEIEVKEWSQWLHKK